MIKEAWLRFKRFVLPYPLANFAKYALKGLLRTCRIEIQGLDDFVGFAKKNRCILSLWHNRLAIVPEVLSGYALGLTFTAVISKSRDGEPLALIVNSYSVGRTIRVAHNDRHGALKSVINHLKDNVDVLVITPDGPRGPRYDLKPGIVAAAKASGAHVVPFSWTADKFWQMKTWDWFMLPKPFSTIKVTFGAPLAVPSHTSLQEDIASLQAHMRD